MTDDPAPRKVSVEKSASSEGEEPPLTAAEKRAFSVIPFLFGGGASIGVAWLLRATPSRSGVPPFWVLFLALGVIALAAGLLMAFTIEPDEEEEATEGGDVTIDGDRVVLPRKEWEKIQEELRRLRSRGESPKEGTSSMPSPEEASSPPTAPPEAAAPERLPS